MSPHRLRSPRRALQALIATLPLAAAGLAQAQVGMSEWRVGALPVTLVYPTQAGSRTQSFGAFTIDVARNAAPLNQRQRLIVISHGTGGSAIADHALAATLARAGFVVAQPLHAGDNYKDTRDAGPVAFERRPREVSQVIDALAKDPLWSARLDLSRVGVHGMSAGGVTGIALAGGQWRTINLARHCNAHAKDDASFCYQGAKDGAARAERQANHDRARYVPDFFLPADLTTPRGGRTPTPDNADPRPDPRVASITLAVPLAAIFSPESLARIRVPVGVVSAQRDEVLVPRFHSAHLLANCRHCTLLADLPGAGHFDLLWPWPESVAREVAALQVRGGLPVPGFDARQRETAHAKIASFHRQHLRD
ncbi:alpha/beta hydrolase family protein [Hydrogenophaga sp. SL48]|uniref:alpha/beta hydrolase family protein n=1 Tax=Hydrogenophaga sp. SL48 TaxID=2806347 RepID=UPI001F471997|nr:dienelactone hydrolase [Hydrogenophaga sp. SL48]UJW79016.1 dienelactone hydrolase [Hydrogenophaga sp. SL48]